MKKEVVMCDFKNGFGPAGVSWTKDCDRAADGECPICLRDACPGHKACTLKLTMSAISMKKLQGEGNPSEDKFPAAEKEFPIGICHECQQFLFGITRQSAFGLGSVLEPALAATIELIRAHSAAQRLTPEKP